MILGGAAHIRKPSNVVYSHAVSDNLLTEVDHVGNEPVNHAYIKESQ